MLITEIHDEDGEKESRQPVTPSPDDVGNKA